MKKREDQNVETATLATMEKLIRSKIAEIEKTYPIQVMEKHLLQRLQQNVESKGDIDENQFCRQFDSEVKYFRSKIYFKVRLYRSLMKENLLKIEFVLFVNYLWNRYAL